MYRFLQTPPSTALQTSDYGNQTSTWKSDVHLLSTYCFLSKEERELFASQEQIYLVKDVYQYSFNDVNGSKKVQLFNSNGMVSSWMWFLRRNDAYMRNEWNNYTNWPYSNLPNNIINAPDTSDFQSSDGNYYGPAKNPSLQNNVTSNTGSSSYTNLAVKRSDGEWYFCGYSNNGGGWGSGNTDSQNQRQDDDPDKISGNFRLKNNLKFPHMTSLTYLQYWRVNLQGQSSNKFATYMDLSTGRMYTTAYNNDGRISTQDSDVGGQYWSVMTKVKGT
jgi:hypothetical protein